MDYNKIAKDIIDSVGGKENIQELTHCFTRLRFVLKDEQKAKKEVSRKIKGVISVVSAGGQYQIVCGAKVEPIYEAIEHQLKSFSTKALKEGQTAAHVNKPKRGWGSRVLQIITQIFTPLVPAIAAAGLIKGILTAVKLIMAKRGIDISASDTYMILYSASQVIFYFFPIFLAFTTAKALKCNTIIAMVLGCTLVYPAIDAMIQDVGTTTTLFGIPVIKAAWQIGDSVKVFSYTESVIPILLAIIVMAYLERLLKRIIPEVVQLILVPGLELIIMLPITFSVLGPIGIYIGNGIQMVYDSVINFSPTFAGILIGGLWGVLVIFGAHRALIPIGLNDVALNGHQNILAFAGAANFAQGGAALGVWLKTKQKEVKQVAASGTIAAALVGVTEPAIYGCNLRYKKPLICAILAGAVGGGIMGFGGVYGDAFANNGVLTIFTYAAFGKTKFFFYLIGIAIAFFGAAILTYIVGFDETQEESESIVIQDTEESEENVSIVEKTNLTQVHEEYSLMSPIQGKVIPLSQIKDEAFSSGSLGDGVGIIPTNGVVVAPDDCTISMIFPSLHAIGLKLDNGIELLIHVGINTVELEGKHFSQHVEQGDHVAKGAPIISFAMEQIKYDGYQLTTPVIVVDSDKYKAINKSYGEAGYENEIIHLTR